MISLICKKYGIENYTINPDGSTDVDGNVDLSFKDLTELPLTFNRITGNFNCGYNRLTSLEYSPRWVDGWFSCFNNELNSLEFSPEYVGGDFDCSDNSNLTNINGYTEKMNGVFYCYETPLQSIFNEVDRNFLHAFNFYKIIKDDTVNLKRLKYVMDLYEQRIDLDKIQKYYRLV